MPKQTLREEIIKKFTQPQDLVDPYGKKIGESHWSPYCIEQLSKAIDHTLDRVEEAIESCDSPNKPSTHKAFNESVTEGYNQAKDEMRLAIKKLRDE